MRRCRASRCARLMQNIYEAERRAMMEMLDAAADMLSACSPMMSALIIRSPAR